MRFTITALGAQAGQTVAQVVDRIVNYLKPQRTERPAPAVSAGAPSAVRYYADRGEEPGRWRGLGAAESGLVGAVASEDFARVLEGRDPRTGARLVTAQGSAGRRPTLGVGAETWRTPDGEPLYDPRDAAALLGLRERDVLTLLDAGQRITTTDADLPPGDTYLVPQVGAGGTRRLSESELARFEQARLDNPAADRVAASGEPADLLSLTYAARLAGVTARYLRSLCRYHEEHAAEITAAVADGRTIRRAFLVGVKTTRGTWQVRRGELVAFLRRRRAPAVRVGFDVTLTTEKSLGVLALLGDDETRRVILDAIRAGNDVGLAYLEEHAAVARAGEHQVGTRGLTIASFQHRTSRALDPFPHHHNVVANTVVDEHGTRRALDARPLYLTASTASALATAEMRYTATRAAGLRWRRAHHGGWEIDGVPEAVCRELSQRRNDIDDAVRELEEAIGRGKTIEELNGIVLATRPAKQYADVADLVAGWWERAGRHGLTPDMLATVTGRRDPATIIAPPDDELFARLAAPDGLCAAGSIFTRADVIAALVDLPVDDGTGGVQPLLVPPAEIERLATAFLTSEHAVELLPREETVEQVPVRLRGVPVFTTPEMLEVQRRILDRYTAGRGRQHAVVPEQVLSATLAEHDWLTGEQRDLVTRFTTSGDQVQCAVGRAGAGKTTTMRAAVAAWTAAGYRVVGTAVKGEAARILSEKADIPTETLAWHLTVCRLRGNPFDERTVLVVDEASTVSDRDLDELLGHVADKGAALRLIGDPAQHGAVAAGGTFRLLCESHPADTPELAKSHRIQHEQDAAAATALREGRIDEAFDLLHAAGHLHVVGSDLELYLDLLRRWWAAQQAGVPFPMVDRRNAVRRQLNRLAHRLLQVAGRVGADELAASGGRMFSVGDEVVARETNRTVHATGDRRAYIRNGAVGTITVIGRGPTPEEDTLTVEFTGTGVIELPRWFFDEHDSRGRRRDVGIDHAYARTSYAVQGADFPTSASRIDEHTSRNEAYVDITRGEQANHLYLTRAADPLDGERLPRVPPPLIADAVADRLHHSRPERAALDLDPDARAPGQYAGLDLYELRAARTTATGPSLAELRRAEHARARAVARCAESRADPQLLALLPARPALPYLLHRWQGSLAAITVYRQRWRPPPGTGPWAWAVGAPSDDPAQTHERNEVLGRLRALAVTCTAEALRGHGWTDLPDWARAYAIWLASHGHCRPDPAPLADLYQRVADYRHRAGLDEPTTTTTTTTDGGGSPMLGPEPGDPALAAIRSGLAHDLDHFTDTAAVKNLPGDVRPREIRPLHRPSEPGLR